MLAVCSFREIFQETFLRLLNEISVLWMTNTISPVHERFISTLIQQKLLLNIERVQGLSDGSSKVYALFLPMNEIHELGLLYIHFELLLRGYKSIYLGASVPMENLLELQKVFSEITFVS
jgi:methanogenic corrinoid protein MtbC1